MLHVNFIAETENDRITPIQVANALIECGLFHKDGLQEIADHLKDYIWNANRRKTE